MADSLPKTQPAPPPSPSPAELGERLKRWNALANVLTQAWLHFPQRSPRELFRYLSLSHPDRDLQAALAKYLDSGDDKRSLDWPESRDRCRAVLAVAQTRCARLHRALKAAAAEAEDLARAEAAAEAAEVLRVAA